jgi:hypothetical protein
MKERFRVAGSSKRWLSILSDMLAIIVIAPNEQESALAIDVQADFEMYSSLSHAKSSAGCLALREACHLERAESLRTVGLLDADIEVLVDDDAQAISSVVTHFEAGHYPQITFRCWA